MKKLFLLFVALVLNGCVLTDQATLYQKKLDLQKQAEESAAQALQKSNEFENEFLKCMKIYGKAKSSLSINPSDMAEASVMECQTPLSYYETYRGIYYSANTRMHYDASFDDYENNKYKAHNDVRELVDKGKRLVIDEIGQQKVKEK
jgi:hypothetical protein